MHKINCDAILQDVCSFLFISLFGRIIYWDINSDSLWYNHFPSIPNRWTTCSLVQWKLKTKRFMTFFFLWNFSAPGKDYPRIREKRFTQTEGTTEVRREASRSKALLCLEAEKTYPLGPSCAGKSSKVLSLIYKSFFLPELSIAI